MRDFLRNNGLSLALGLMFLVSVTGMVLTGRAAFNKELADHGLPGLDLLAYVGTGEFLSALFENWESEFLQMATYVVLTAMLFQRGSSESRDPDEPFRPGDEVPWRARHPLAAWLYAHSLGLVLALLFIASFLLHWRFSMVAANAEALRHGGEAQMIWGYLVNPQLWFESFQNWQSEFLSTAVLVVLSIFLRHRGGQNGVWGRIEAAHASFDPTRSTSGTDYDQDLWKLQAGMDGMLKEFESGSLIAGVNGFYGTLDTDVSSIYGTGRIDTTGYGFGGTLTWYGNNGFYVDGQASVTWYESDLKSDLVSTLAKDLDGLGYAFSMEAGKRYEVSPSWYLIPQAQLVYSNVSVDSFYDRFDVRVSLGDAESLRGRLGLAVERQTNWTAANGQKRHASVYGIGNLYYEFLDGTSLVDVAGTTIVSGGDDFWGEIGLGGTVALTERLDLYGEARYATSFENAGDNNVYGGNIGLRLFW